MSFEIHQQHISIQQNHFMYCSHDLGQETAV